MFSETREAETYCGIMKPLFRPLPSIRNGGRPESEASTIRAWRRSEMLPNSAMASPKKSMARARGSPWKFPPLRASPSSGKIRGLSVTELISVSSTPRT